MQGTSGCEFNDEVLSWHRINGQEAEDILPAILITNIHPSQFRDGAFHVEPHRQIVTENLILIPIRDICETSTDVAILINQIFTDIQQKKSLPQFEVARQLKKGQRGALVDALILEPNFSGIGIDLRKLFGFFSRH
jgi:hypothetical protein